jgi:hypothetical protein
MYNNVSWLNRGCDLQGSVECLKLVDGLTNTKSILQELSVGEMFSILLLFADCSLHLNEVIPNFKMGVGKQYYI